ncbi:MAG TPA: FAD binding domain-containing protein, partial [Kiloniellaceae bacterium]|nr:FAD binding domain-containing protein [Kiloniellaceae bacterium]
MYDFTHHRPTSVDAAVKAIAGASDGKIIAGGMTLIPTLKQRLASPSDVVDLGAIKDLKGIREEGGKIVI